jgi:chromosome segregation ATPase
MSPGQPLPMPARVPPHAQPSLAAGPPVPRKAGLPVFFPSAPVFVPAKGGSKPKKQKKASGWEGEKQAIWDAVIEAKDACTGMEGRVQNVLSKISNIDSGMITEMDKRFSQLSAVIDAANKNFASKIETLMTAVSLQNEAQGRTNKELEERQKEMEKEKESVAALKAEMEKMREERQKEMDADMRTADEVLKAHEAELAA